mgnify:CR=1 FL=1
MPLMQWNESLKVGIDAVDGDHQKLVGMVNELFDAMQAGRGKDVLGKVLDELASYTAQHFAREESYFARTGYPDSAAHKKEHDDLRKQVNDVQAKFKSGATATLTIDVLNFLRDWLVKHIKGSDMKYAPHLKAKGIR